MSTKLLRACSSFLGAQIRRISGAGSAPAGNPAARATLSARRQSRRHMPHVPVYPINPRLMFPCSSKKEAVGYARTPNARAAFIPSKTG